MLKFSEKPENIYIFLDNNIIILLEHLGGIYMIDKQKALAFVREYLGNTQKTNNATEIKNKFEHIKRVHRNAKTLCHFLDDIDAEAVEMAAIFHDVGHFESQENHAQISSRVAKEYLQNEGMEVEFIDRVCQAIENHSNKTTDDSVIDQLSLEDKVLIDADMIDYTGVKEIVWTAMKEGSQEICYDRCLRKIDESIETMGQYVKIAHTKKARELLLKNLMVAKGVAHTIEYEIKGDMV